MDPQLGSWENWHQKRRRLDDHGNYFSPTPALSPSTPSPVTSTAYQAPYSAARHHSYAYLPTSQLQNHATSAQCSATLPSQQYSLPNQIAHNNGRVSDHVHCNASFASSSIAHNQYTTRTSTAGKNCRDAMAPSFPSVPTSSHESSYFGENSALKSFRPHRETSSIVC